MKQKVRDPIGEHQLLLKIARRRPDSLARVVVHGLMEGARSNKNMTHRHCGADRDWDYNMFDRSSAQKSSHQSATTADKGHGNDYNYDPVTHISPFCASDAAGWSTSGVSRYKVFSLGR